MSDPPDTAELRILPRSLDPLEDESLSGFLLRLSHRLGVEPGQLASRTGLTTHSEESRVPILSMNLAYVLDEDRLAMFARTTRLTPSEATGLLLAPLTIRYGPLKTGARQRLTNPWVLTDRRQYCPDCLRGDGTPIEQQYGGPWRRNWHLPVVFACLRHQRVLLHRCMTCNNLIHGDAKGLVTRPADAGLHPVQCRASLPATGPRASRPACGADLTTAVMPRDQDLLRVAHRTREILFPLQEWLLTLLSPDGPEQVNSVGWLVPTPQYFIDLKTVAGLILMTWPVARPRALTRTVTRLLDSEVERRRRLFQHFLARPGKQHRIGAYTAPPQNPAVTGVLLEMAHRFLNTDDEEQASHDLGPLAVEAVRRHQPAAYALRTTRGASFPLQVALLAHRRAENRNLSPGQIITARGEYHRTPGGSQPPVAERRRPQRALPW